MPDADEMDELTDVAGPESSGPAAGSSADSTADSAADSRADSAELAAAREDAEQQRRLYHRALADLDNYKKRAERQIAEAGAIGRREALKRVLPVLDNLQRAAQYRDNGMGLEQLAEGLAATLKQFEALLEAERVKPIEILGKPFDPAVSEAVGTRHVDDLPDETVLDEAVRGYTIGDDLLRPAQVIVNKK